MACDEAGFAFPDSMKKMATIYKMKIAVVILNYNGLEDTLESLESLRRCKQDGYQVEIIVVDNGSNDGSVEFLQESYAHVKLVAFNCNTGFAAAANRFAGRTGIGIYAQARSQGRFRACLF